MKLQKLIFSAGTLWCMATPIAAIQMGEVRTTSRLGEPLTAYVNVYSGPNEDFSQLKAVASPHSQFRYHQPLTQLIQGLRTSIEFTRHNGVRVKIVSTTKVLEPAIAFRLKLHYPGGTIVRHYSLALPNRRIRSAMRLPAPRGRETQLLLPNDNQYGPVAPGDTLSAIAVRLASSLGLNLSSAITHLYAENPSAFINGDINRLRAGALLNLGSGREPRSAVRTPATALPPRATQSATRKKISWRDLDPEAAAELDARTKKYAAIRREIENKTRVEDSVEKFDKVLPNASAGETQLSQSTNAAEFKSPKAIDAIVPSEVTQVNTALNRERVKTRMATSGSALSNTFRLIAFSVAAIVFFLGLYFLWKWLAYRRNAKYDQTIELPRQENALLDSEKQLETEKKVDDLPEESPDFDPDATLPAFGGTSLGLDSTSSEQSLPDLIDHNIAHGRYEEAEKMLVKVVTDAPRNYEAQLRLAEVYYITEKVPEFVSVANDIYNHHREDISDEQWRRIMRMGKIVAPNTPPFSGPRNISAPEEAS